MFDAKRGLSLFNPALTDLTALPVDFLSARPTLHAFIDRLREARRMPEPRDWRSWRERITALEAASTEGTYLETWNLPAGQTWRVSGRPHPDGAIALMFEDITAEISLTPPLPLGARGRPGGGGRHARGDRRLRPRRGC